MKDARHPVQLNCAKSSLKSIRPWAIPSMFGACFAMLGAATSITVVYAEMITPYTDCMILLSVTASQHRKVCAPSELVPFV